MFYEHMEGEMFSLVWVSGEGRCFMLFQFHLSGRSVPAWPSHSLAIHFHYRGWVVWFAFLQPYALFDSFVAEVGEGFGIYERGPQLFTRKYFPEQIFRVQACKQIPVPEKTKHNLQYFLLIGNTRYLNHWSMKFVNHSYHLCPSVSLEVEKICELRIFYPRCCNKGRLRPRSDGSWLRPRTAEWDWHVIAYRSTKGRKPRLMKPLNPIIILSHANETGWVSTVDSTRSSQVNEHQFVMHSAVQEMLLHEINCKT